MKQDCVSFFDRPRPGALKALGIGCFLERKLILLRFVQDTLYYTFFQKVLFLSKLFFIVIKLQLVPVQYTIHVY